MCEAGFVQSTLTQLAAAGSNPLPLPSPPAKLGVIPSTASSSGGNDAASGAAGLGASSASASGGGASISAGVAGRQHFPQMHDRKLCNSFV